jgi:hypothetical protein
MEHKEQRVIYHYNFFVQALCFGFGIFSLLFTYFIINVNIIDETYGKPDVLDFGVLFFIGLLFLSFGVGCFITPAVTKLTLDEKGYIYQTMSLKVTAAWTESHLSNYLRPIFGKWGFIVPLSPNLTLNRSAKYLGVKAFSGGIPINYFGGFSSRKVRRDIRKHAPYLFGILHTESDFVTTLDALDRLIERYRKAEIHPHMFYTQYNRFYRRYIISGKDFVADSFNMMTKYSEKIAYLTAVWNEIVKPYFPDYEEKRQNDEMQIRGINERYARDE